MNPPTCPFMYHTPILQRCKKFFMGGNDLLRKAKIGGYRKKCNIKQCISNTWSSTKTSKLTFRWVNRLKRREKHIPMLWKFLSVDTGIRCDWLLDLHAAFKAKSREQRTHNLHYSWGTEDKGHSSVVCLPPSPASRESVFETTTFYRFLDQNP